MHQCMTAIIQYVYLYPLDIQSYSSHAMLDSKHVQYQLPIAFDWSHTVFTPMAIQALFVLFFHVANA